MSKTMSRIFAAGTLSISMLSACQALPKSSNLIVPPSPSLTSQIQPSPTSLTPSPPLNADPIATPLTTPLPNPDQVPHQQQPSPGPQPYPTPILVPTPNQQPNPWPTNIGLRYEGDPIPTPPPEPTPHPGDCGSCEVKWSTIHHPVWVGSQLVYFQNQQSTLYRRMYSNRSDFKLYRWQTGQTPEQLAFQQMNLQLSKLTAISDKQILFQTALGQEPNLSIMSLATQAELNGLPVKQVLDAALSPDRQSIAWISYENSRENMPLYTSSVTDFKPELKARISSQGVDKLSWMPNQQGWAFLELNSPNPPKPLIQRLDIHGSQSNWLTVPASGPWPEKVLNFKFSPDGKHLAIVVESMTVSQGNKGIYWKGILWLGSADGKNLKQISSLGRVDADFEWSPDSSKLVVAVGTGEAEKPEAIDLYTVNAETTSLQRLTNSSQNPKWQHTQPRWSPDGQQISFISNRDADFRLNLFIPDSLYLIKPDGTGLNTITKGNYSTQQVNLPQIDVGF